MAKQPGFQSYWDFLIAKAQSILILLSLSTSHWTSHKKVHSTVCLLLLLHSLPDHALSFCLMVNIDIPVTPRSSPHSPWVILSRIKGSQVSVPHYQAWINSLYSKSSAYIGSAKWKLPLFLPLHHAPGFWHFTWVWPTVSWLKHLVAEVQWPQ